MRTLFVTRGAPGAGKTTRLNEIGLDGYAISMDAIRDIVASPTMTEFGIVQRSQEHNNRVYSMMMRLVEERMSRGEVLVVDAAHSRAKDIRKHVSVADRYGYRVVCLDFSSVPLEACLERNEQRRGTPSFVPERTIEAMHQVCLEGKVPEGVDVVDQADAEKVFDYLKVPVEDFSSFRKIHHIGDLQGCHSVLFGEGGYLEGGFDDRDLYIFVGDACDRGIENGRVMHWLIDDVIDRDNVIFLRGNHELHLEREARGDEPVSAEFRDRTLPQLRQAGVTRQELGHFCSKLRDVVLYTFGDKRIMVTHAGLPKIPEAPGLISSYQYTHGTGHFQSPVDHQFTRTYDTDLKAGGRGFYQVHGHRNHGMLPVWAAKLSFNLEDSVEYGGNFRGVTLDQDGFHTHERRNYVFAPKRERREVSWAPQAAPWIARRDDGRVYLSENELSELVEHDLVRQRTTESYPHVASFNFTRAAFWDGRWDQINIRARGLFVNTNTHEVVARGYEKFFNIGEREETRLDNLMETLVFPVQAWVKENGFFGTIGYDSETDDLFVASKSMSEGPFAEWLREIFEAQVSPEKREWLRRYLRDNEACLTVEANDPVNDPHMFEYETRHLVLLDVLRRSLDFERLPYDPKDGKGGRRESIVGVAQTLGIKAKEKGPLLHDAEQLEKWLANVGRYDFKHKGGDGYRHIEGYVLEDENGMYKTKLPFYAFWKYMRSVKDRVRTIRGTNKPLQRNVEDPAAYDFYQWCLEQPTELLEKDIISVRHAYLAERPDPTAFWRDENTQTVDSPRP